MNTFHAGFEYIVILNFVDGSTCRTAYPRNMQAAAIACFQQYIADGKMATLTIE
jgi:hypothetical protein